MMLEAARSALHGERAARPLGLRARRRRAESATRRRGLTLVEMLIATAVTLLMMSAVLNLFANLGGSVRNRRALIEVDGRLRQARAQLARDLAGATCPATTWHNPGANEGYLEILEGRYTDWVPSQLVDGNVNNDELDYATSQVPSSQMIDPTSGAVTDGGGLGDHDDVLMLTVRNDDEPFIAFVEAEIYGSTGPDVKVESSLGEVIWFAEENDEPAEGEFGMRRVFRRVLLIAPWLGRMNNYYGSFNNPPDSISAHWDGNRWVANTLGDLTKRENRFQHPVDYNNAILGFPHELRVGRLDQGGNEPEWLMLNDAVAFDIRVYDPDAPVYAVNGTAIEPSDAGWDNLTVLPNSASPASLGAYVDLGWNWHPTAGSQRRDLSNANIFPPSAFQWPLRAGALPSANFLRQGYPATYDTWSLHYENDGFNQDQRRAGDYPWRLAIDQGSNGLDDDNRNGVDDKGERETAPPYDVPLRGVKVIVRVYEQDARQVRATSVVHSFVD